MFRVERYSSAEIKTLLFAAALVFMYALLALIFPMAAFLQEFGDMGVALTVAFAALYVMVT